MKSRMHDFIIANLWLFLDVVGYRWSPDDRVPGTWRRINGRTQEALLDARSTCAIKPTGDSQTMHEFIPRTTDYSGRR